MNKATFGRVALGVAVYLVGTISAATLMGCGGGEEATVTCDKNGEASYDFGDLTPEEMARVSAVRENKRGEFDSLPDISFDAGVATATGCSPGDPVTLVLR